MFQFFETIRIENGVTLNLEYHQRRMDKTMFDIYGISKAHSLNRIIKAAAYSQGITKCKVEYNQNDFCVMYEPYSVRKVNSLKLLVSEEISYNYKYCDRRDIIGLMKLRGTCDDILIVQHGQITDTSYSNIAFSDGHHWYTPVTPLLHGTSRQRLIDSGILRVRDITVRNLDQFKTYKLINCMLSFDSSQVNSIKSIIQ